MNTLNDVVTFGEIMGCFVATTPGRLSDVSEFERRLAGSELNVAIGLSRLGHHVGFVGVIGDDPIGEVARQRLSAEGVDTIHLRTDPVAHTGLLLKERAEYGDPQVVYYRRGAAGALLRSGREVLGYLSSARHVHATGIPPALSGSARAFAFEALDAARAAGCTISFDPNLRPSLWQSRPEMTAVVGALAERADWVLLGVEEGCTLTGRSEPGEIAQHYLRRGAKAVAVKHGARGAQLFTAHETISRPAFAVDTVDTVGAGDGFAAGFISAALTGDTPADQLARACAVGALATTSAGDCDGLPTVDQVEQLLRRDSVYSHAGG